MAISRKAGRNRIGSPLVVYLFQNIRMHHRAHHFLSKLSSQAITFRIRSASSTFIIVHHCIYIVSARNRPPLPNLRLEVTRQT